MYVDGLYINGRWVAEVDYALTLQGNDITKPDERRASYSNSFSIPDTIAMREVLQGGEQVDSGGKNPYQKLPAFLIENGEVLFYGFAEFVKFAAGWSVNLLDAMLGFFDNIRDKKLNEHLDLERYNHKWDIPTINSLAGATEGVVYPLIDSGAIEGNVVPYDTATPAVYVKDVLFQIIAEAGYKPTGVWLEDKLFLSMALPFTREEPTAAGQEWIDDRTARVTVAPATLGREVNHIIPFSIDADLEAGFQDGKLDNFRPGLFAYVPDVNMRLRVQASQSYDVTIISGGIEAFLAIEKNGVEVARNYVTHAGPYNLIGAKRDILEIDEEVTCKAGDNIQIRFMFGKRTTFANWKVTLVENDLNTWASFMPVAVVQFEDIWPVSRNLPELSYTELVIAIAQIMGGSYNVNDTRKTVELVTLNQVKGNIGRAKDWSNRIDETTEPELAVQFEGYGKRNWLRWKEQEKAEDRGYGDGFIAAQVDNLPNEEELFELPFSAVLPSKRSIQGYGTPLLIQTRTISRKGEEATINKQAANPCIILIEPDCIVEVNTKTLSPAGDIVDERVKLTGCWFAVRTMSVKRPDNAYSLAFSPVKGQSEEPLIVRYYTALQGVLRRPKSITLSMYLSPTDIATLDLAVPILLQGVRVGALDFNYGYYYLNKVSSYRSGVSCPVTLIAL